MIKEKVKARRILKARAKTKDIKAKAKGMKEVVKEK